MLGLPVQASRFETVDLATAARRPSSPMLKPERSRRRRRRCDRGHRRVLRGARLVEGHLDPDGLRHVAPRLLGRLAVRARLGRGDEPRDCRGRRALAQPAARRLRALAGIDARRPPADAHAPELLRGRRATAFALSQPTPRLSRRGFHAVGILLFSFWQLGTLTGSLAGSAIGDPKRYGIDTALPAALLAMLWPQLGSRRAQVAAVSGSAIAVGLTPVLQPGLPIMLASFGVVLALARR